MANSNLPRGTPMLWVGVIPGKIIHTRRRELDKPALILPKAQTHSSKRLPRGSGWRTVRAPKQPSCGQVPLRPGDKRVSGPIGTHKLHPALFTQVGTPKTTKETEVQQVAEAGMMRSK